MYKEDLALNNLQWLICYKTKPNCLTCHMTISEPIQVHPFNHQNFTMKRDLPITFFLSLKITLMLEVLSPRSYLILFKSTNYFTIISQSHLLINLQFTHIH